MAMDPKKFDQPEDVASEPFGWKHDTQAHSMPLPETQGMSVDEVHQYDAPYGGKASLKPGPPNATGNTRHSGNNNRQ